MTSSGTRPEHTTAAQAGFSGPYGPGPRFPPELQNCSPLRQVTVAPPTLCGCEQLAVELAGSEHPSTAALAGRAQQLARMASGNISDHARPFHLAIDLLHLSPGRGPCGDQAALHVSMSAGQNDLFSGSERQVNCIHRDAPLRDDLLVYHQSGNSGESNGLIRSSRDHHGVPGENEIRDRAAARDAVAVRTGL